MTHARGASGRSLSSCLQSGVSVSEGGAAKAEADQRLPVIDSGHAVDEDGDPGGRRQLDVAAHALMSL